jgi:hypothetical protein
MQTAPMALVLPIWPWVVRQLGAIARMQSFLRRTSWGRKRS